MARQPLNKLAGFDATSQSAARPIDSFGGTPAAPKVPSSVTQIADAIGLVSNASMKYRNRLAAEERSEAKAEERALGKARATAYAARWSAEEENGILTAVQMGEEFADVSSAVLSTLVQDENRSRYYKSAKEALTALDDATLLDPAKTDELYASLIDQAMADTDGFDFAQAGAIQGVENAISEMSGQHANTRDAVVRKRSEASLRAQVFELLDATRDYEEIVAGFDLIDSKATPFDNAGKKQIYVDALIAYDLANEGQDPIAQKVINGIKFLQGPVTSQKMSEFAPKITELNIARMRREDYLKDRQRTIDFAEAQSKIFDLAVSDDYAGLESVMAKSAGLTGEAAILGNQIYKAAEAALESAKMDATESVSNQTILEEDIKFAASTGDYSELGFEDTASLEDLTSYIMGRTDIRAEHKQNLLENLPTYMEGFKLVNNTEANNRFRNSFRESISLIQGNPKVFFLTRAGINVNTTVRNIYDDTMRYEIDTIMQEEGRKPTPTEMRAVYDLAVEKANAKVAQLESLIDGKGNDTAEIAAYGALESPGVPGEVVNGYEFIGPANVKGSRKDPNNWQKVDAPVQESSGDGDDLGTAPTTTSEPEASTNLTKTADDFREIKEKSDQKVEATYESISDIFDRESQQFTLPDDTMNGILATLEEMSTMTTDQGLLVQTPPDSSKIKDVILEALGLTGDSNFDYGGLDRADKDGELGIQKLVETIKQMRANNR